QNRVRSKLFSLDPPGSEPPPNPTRSAVCNTSNSRFAWPHSQVTDTGKYNQIGRSSPKAAFQTTPADATLGPLLPEGLAFFDGHEHGPGLGTLRRPDHTLAFQQIHDAPGP